MIRPAASEWDEKEQTPWPVIQEAAKIGLYGLDSSVNLFVDPSGLLLPIVSEEVFWGDAGIGMSLMGTGLASSAIFSSGTPDQWNTWLPRCYGTADDVQVAAFCSSEPSAGSDVSAIRTRATYDEKSGDWVINGQKAWATNGGIADVHVVVATVDPSLGSKGQAAFVVPRSEVTGLEQGTKLRKHGLRASHTADVFFDDVRIPAANLLGGKEKLDERVARAREGGSSRGNASMATFEMTRHVVGIAGDRNRAGGVRVRARVRQGPRAVRPADHRQPGHRVQARGHGDGDRRGPAAGLARRRTCRRH